MSGEDVIENGKDEAIKRIQFFYKAHLASQEVERESLEAFAKVCQESHEHLTDEAISDLTIEVDRKGYSRARIQQLRKGKISKKQFQKEGS